MAPFWKWEESGAYGDYEAPLNPRADPKKSRRGKIPGCAAAITSYDCIDAVISTDTLGNMTQSAHWSGCFGLRPSTRAISRDGIAPGGQHWEVPGILARDLAKCKKIAENWLRFDTFEKIPEEVSCIVWPVELWEKIDKAQSEKAKSFASDMADKLGVCFKKDFKFTEQWTKDNPTKCRKCPNPACCLQNLLDSHIATCLAYDTHESIGNLPSQFRKLFSDSCTRDANKQIWLDGKQVRLDAKVKALEEISAFRGWFEKLLRKENHLNPIIVMPLEAGEPVTRTKTPFFRRPPVENIAALSLGPIMESPVLAVPFDQISYNLRSSKYATSKSKKEETEILPIAVALMGMPGTDLKLIDTAITALQSLGIPTEVDTGSDLYSKV
ncbi:hypothetical protein TrVFT333_010413 [Trichoderma virens FT-333]|nr:hypothetical protein TrVFT333_010413 [Trichoderma virens FT-333]